MNEFKGKTVLWGFYNTRVLAFRRLGFWVRGFKLSGLGFRVWGVRVLLPDRRRLRLSLSRSVFLSLSLCLPLSLSPDQCGANVPGPTSVSELPTFTSQIGLQGESESDAQNLLPLFGCIGSTCLVAACGVAALPSPVDHST